MESPQQHLKIAIDFGGVLSCHDRGQPASGEHESTAVSMPHCIEAMKQLKAAGHKLYLNSFCGRNRAIETKAAIDKEIPGIFDEVYFVKSKKFKGALCKHLGCDVMIDDRLDILTNIHDAKHCPNLMWFKGDPTFEDKQKIPPTKNILEIYSWENAVKMIAEMKPTATADPKIDISPFIHSIISP